MTTLKIKNGTFISVYFDVLEELHLTPSEYVICKTIQDRANGVWYGSKDKLAELVGLSNSYIYKVTQKLLERKILRKKKKYRKGYHYDHLALNDAFYQAVSDAQHKHAQDRRKSRKITLLLDLKEHLGITYEQYFSLETVYMLSKKYGGKVKQFLSDLSRVTRQSIYNYFNAKTGVLLKKRLAILKNETIYISDKYKHLREVILHQTSKKGHRTPSISTNPNSSKMSSATRLSSPPRSPSSPQTVGNYVKSQNLFTKRREQQQKACENYSNILYNQAHRLKLIEKGKKDRAFEDLAKTMKIRGIKLKKFEVAVIREFEQLQKQLVEAGKLNTLYTTLKRPEICNRLKMRLQKE